MTPEKRKPAVAAAGRYSKPLNEERTMNALSVAQPTETNIRYGKTRVIIADMEGSHEIVAWIGPDLEPATFITTPQDARDAAAALLEGAVRLEELNAADKGLRIFDVGDSPYRQGQLCADRFIIGVQTTNETGHKRLFRNADEGRNKVGDTWGSELRKRDKRGLPEFFHEIIARAKYLSSYMDNDGRTVYRYVEVTD